MAAGWRKVPASFDLTQRPSSPNRDGDPIANIKLVENPAQNFRVIMKDGTIYKNTVG
jgi:hypothetical protein